MRVKRPAKGETWRYESEFVPPVAELLSQTAGRPDAVELRYLAEQGRDHAAEAYAGGERATVGRAYPAKRYGRLPVWVTASGLLWFADCYICELTFLERGAREALLARPRGVPGCVSLRPESALDAEPAVR